MTSLEQNALLAFYMVKEPPPLETMLRVAKSEEDAAAWLVDACGLEPSAAASAAPHLMSALREMAPSSTR